MLSLAIAAGLQFPVRQTDIDGILHLWEMEVKRFVNGFIFRGILFISICILEPTGLESQHLICMKLVTCMG
jgi:hypothetical protein